MMEAFRGGFEVIEEMINFNTPSLKGYLGGWVCYRVVSEKVTTLGLLGLMKESNKILLDKF
jgi:hypothetical protein